MAEAVAARSKAWVHRVDPAPHPLGAPPADLIGHGVGQGLDGDRTGDCIAVEVQQGVQLGQGLGAMTDQNGDAGRAQATTPEVAVFGWERPQGSPTVGGGPPPVVVLDSWPESVS